MRLLTVPLARALWFIDVAELNPRGKNVFVDLVPALIKEFKFNIYPTEGEDFKDGMKFQKGTFGNSAGNQLSIALTIYSDGFAADTYSSTNDSEEFLRYTLKIAGDLGYQFSDSMIRRKTYLSQIFVECNKNLDALNSKLSTFGDLLAKELGVEHRCSALEFWPDQTRSVKPSNFSFQLKTGEAFGENRYWSQSALPTERHLALLDEFEKILS